MKIVQKKLKTKHLLKLSLIKSRVYDQKVINNSNYLLDKNISKIILKLKKSIQVIFKFHKQKKRILFIGMPLPIEKKINFKTNHTAVPKFFNTSGLFINKSVVKSFNLKSKIFQNGTNQTFSELIYKPDLLVIFNLNKDSSIIKESYRVKIPVIQFNTDFDSRHNSFANHYEVPGNLHFNKKIVYNFFFEVINSILTK